MKRPDPETSVGRVYNCDKIIFMSDKVQISPGLSYNIQHFEGIYLGYVGILQ